MTYTTNPAIYSFRPIMELERLLNNAATRQSAPKVNIVQTENGSELRIAIPGIKKEQLYINLEDRILKIESRKENDETISKSYTYLIKEFDYANFNTEYKISGKVDIEKIDANYSDGILTIFLPLKREEILEKTKKIELK